MPIMVVCLENLVQFVPASLRMNEMGEICEKLACTM